MDCKSIYTGSIPVLASIPDNSGLRLMVAAIAVAPSAPPHLQAPPPAAHHRQIDGEDQQAQRNHPESQHGQKAEQPADDQHQPQNQPDKP